MSLIRKINVNLPPAHGYTFTNTDGTVFTGNTWVEVIKRLEMYRRRNRMPLGDPEAEVIAQAIAREPMLKVTLPPERPVKHREPPPPVPPKPPSVKARVLRWLSEIQKKVEAGALGYVQVAEHEARVQICKRCPKREDALKGGCQPCEKALAGYRSTILGRRPLAGPDACKVLGEDLKTASWLQELTVDNKDLPANCWRKKTL